MKCEHVHTLVQIKAGEIRIRSRKLNRTPTVSFLVSAASPYFALVINIFTYFTAE